MYMVWKSNSADFSCEPTLAHVLARIEHASFLEVPARVVTSSGMELQVALSPIKGFKHEQLSLACHGNVVPFLLDELQNYTHSNGQALAPWAMSRQNWQAFRAIGALIFHVIQGYEGDADHDLFMIQQRMGYGHNGPLYDGKNTNCRHEVHVLYALLRGEAVPAHVLDQYRNQTQIQHNDCTARIDWLLKYPRAIGCINMEQVVYLERLSRRDKLTDELSEAFVIQAIEALRGKNITDYVSIDDVLFQSGILKAYDLPAQKDEWPAPYNDAALRLQNHLQEQRHKESAMQLAREKAAGNLTLRSFLLKSALIDRDRTSRNMQDKANRILQAIENGDIKFLLDLLDKPDNRSLKKFIKSEYGLDLINVNASHRKMEIFRLAGVTNEKQINAFLSKKESDRKVSLRVKSLERLKAQARLRRFQLNGQVMTGDCFVEKLINDGFTKIRKDSSTASSRYYITNPRSNTSYRLKISDRTLPYAQALLGCHPIEEDRSESGAKP